MRQKVILPPVSPAARWPRFVMDRGSADDAARLLPPWFLEQLGWPLEAVAAPLKPHPRTGRRPGPRQKSSRSSS